MESGGLQREGCLYWSHRITESLHQVGVVQNGGGGWLKMIEGAEGGVSILVEN